MFPLHFLIAEVVVGNSGFGFTCFGPSISSSAGCSTKCVLIWIHYCAERAKILGEYSTFGGTFSSSGGKCLGVVVHHRG